MGNNVLIAGAGFSSLAAACYLAKEGYSVTIFEKNPSIGGRARQLKKDGFTFDMGPSWYWMPDIFERFFADFGKKVSDYYKLIRLDPAYRVYFGSDDFIDIGDDLDTIAAKFESLEPGAGDKLRQFIARAKKNYEIAILDLVYRPGESPLELITWDTFRNVTQFAGTISRDIRKLFKHPKLIRILEFPVLFLGAKPSDTPSFYSFMNYADFGLGTWHPETGMFDVVAAMESLATELGVRIRTSSPVERIVVENGRATGLVVNGETISGDIILSGADYAHTETLLPEAARTYSTEYWEKRVFAPSCLVFYAGFSKPVEGVPHHALFFDADFDTHTAAIYDRPEWPKEPLFYANFPSKTDKTAAPEGMESGFFLVPLAPGIEDTEAMRERCFENIMTRFEAITGQPIRENLLFRIGFCKNDFEEAYHSYKGNAYGLANTLMQTAFLRPKLRSRKVKNLYFAGQLTVPGPGVPPSLISGKLSAELIRTYNPILQET